MFPLVAISKGMIWKTADVPFRPILLDRDQEFRPCLSPDQKMNHCSKKPKLSMGKFARKNCYGVAWETKKLISQE
jgi:hypothetical protein